MRHVEDVRGNSFIGAKQGVRRDALAISCSFHQRSATQQRHYRVAGQATTTRTARHHMGEENFLITFSSNYSESRRWRISSLTRRPSSRHKSSKLFYYCNVPCSSKFSPHCLLSPTIINTRQAKLNTRPFDNNIILFSM